MIQFLSFYLNTFHLVLHISEQDWSPQNIYNNKMCLWNTNAPNDGQFQRWPRSQGQIHGYQLEDLVTRNAHVQFKALVLTVQKYIARLNISKNGSNSRVQVTRSKIMVPTERSYDRKIHVKYQSSRTHCSKVNQQDKMFLKNGVKLKGQGHRVK